MQPFSRGGGLAGSMRIERGPLAEVVGVLVSIPPQMEDRELALMCPESQHRLPLARRDRQALVPPAEWITKKYLVQQRDG